MAQPRQVLPGQFHQLTRRCSQRQFLLRPDDATNNAFIYCLAEAAERFEIEILMTSAESNHHHTTVFDRHGRYPAFMEHFHKMLARSQNALRGRWENFWAAEEPCVTRLLDRETVIAQMVYAAANPVKDGLVERVHHWPGVNGYRYLLSGRPLRAKRPRHFFRNPGPMPEVVELTLTIPPELGPADDVIAEVRGGTGTRLIRRRFTRGAARPVPRSARIVSSQGCARDRGTATLALIHAAAALDRTTRCVRTLGATRK